MPTLTLTLATVTAIAAVAPTGSARADAEPPALVAPSVLAISSAGHASLEGQLRAHRHAEHLRRARARRRRRLDQQGEAAPPVLRRIAECESHGNPRSVGGGGTYRGAYQFTAQTWSSVGGRGDPAAAAMPEQTRRAARLLKRSGRSPWPACGR